MRITKTERQVFPEVFCLEDVQCRPRATGGYNYRAVLYHDYACITVSFEAKKRDPRLNKGSFVSVYWLSTAESDCGAIKVAGLCLRRCSVMDFNPFQSVPRAWGADRHLINCARDLWNIAPQALRKTLMSILIVNAERR